MSMLEFLQNFKKLVREDFKVLSAIEREMSKHEYVPVQRIVFASSLTEEEVLYRLSRLNKLGMIMRRLDLGYEGYQLTTRGYDALALNALVSTNILTAICGILGMGKEADVLEGLDPSGEKIALKFHRSGLTFYQIRRLRDYIGNRRHISWLYVSRLAAQREFEALKRLYPEVSVPRPYAQNRHVVVMESFRGDRLVDMSELEDPKGVFDSVIENVRKAYELGIIHADLSGFNILVDERENITIIDWPQYVTVEHPQALDLLARDIRNVTKVFRKFGIKKDWRDVLREVVGS